MFVGDEVLLGVGFPAARAGLAGLAGGHRLVRAAEDAYGAGITGLVAGTAPADSAPGAARLAEVRVRDQSGPRNPAAFIMRWTAIGLTGGVFPALDADLTLVPAEAKATLLRLAGVYRPPPAALAAGLGAAPVSRAAAATVQAFLAQVAIVLAGLPAGEA